MEQITSIDTMSESPPAGKKNYRSIFWNFFWFGLGLNLTAGYVEPDDTQVVWKILYLVGVVIYIYLFSKTINEAMLSIGKKNWWLLGLLALVPAGFWVVFFIVRAKLKPHGQW